MSSLATRPTTPAARLATVALPFMIAACGGSGGSDTATATAIIDRQVFVDAFVALRTAELGSRSVVITEQARDSVLAVHGIAHDDLLAFVDAHGGDTEFMSALWIDVQERMEAVSQRE